MRGKFDRKVCSILVKAGILSEPESQEVLKRVPVEDGKGLEDVLFDEGGVDEISFLAALSRETRLPPIEVRKVIPQNEAVSSLSKDLAEYYGVLPFSRVGKLLTVAVSNPFDLPKFDELSVVTSCEIRTVLGTGRAIKEMIRKSYNPVEKELLESLQGKEGEAGKVEVQEQKEEEEDKFAEMVDLSAMKNLEGDSPVVKLVTLIISQAIRERASDVHIHPGEKNLSIRYRIDGALQDYLSPPKAMHPEIITRIKVMASLNVAERRLPQDGRIQTRFEGRQVDLRVSLIPSIHGERVVLRLLDSSNLATMNVANIGFEKNAEDVFRTAINASYGMILVTGPTGSGKTTTLYASLNEILRPEENVTTVEDPVEYQLFGVNQVPVNVKRGLTFAGALRSILRQDPDIVMIGEIRDLETADIAIKAALTGHLVLSTVHTNDAVGTIPRLIDMGVDSFLVASSLLAATAQRLLRHLCKSCRRPMEKLPPEDYLISLGFKPEELRDLVLYDPVGCPQCVNGYRGRFGIFEVLGVDEDVRRMIVEGASAQEVKKTAVEKKGMATLRRCAIMNVIRGRTTIPEILSNTLSDGENE
jgi:type IV pilus assembly protein PilB